MLAEGLHLFEVETDSHQVKIIAEITLVWVLFADASRIRISDLRADLGRCVRLLGLGLPLTIALGAVAGLHVARDQSVVRIAARRRASSD